MTVDEFVEILKKSIKATEEGERPKMVKYNDDFIQINGDIDLNKVKELLDQQD